VATPPLPASSVVRVRLDYTSPDGAKAGSRFYIGYSGSTPTAANLDTLATDVAAAWQSHLANLVTTTWTLSEVDILDITTLTGATGNWTGSNPGLLSGTDLPYQVAQNIEFQIARRYRGGKPRMFVPPATQSQLQDGAHWTDAYVADMILQCGNFFSEIEGDTVGSMGSLSHVNVSYYSGYNNVPFPSGRTKVVPKYRATALVDTVTGYLAKKELSSQRRRRVATTY